MLLCHRWWTSWLAVLAHVDSLVPEQVIDVPKISWPSRFPRTVLCEPQKVDQLVEATTLVFFVGFIEQTVDIRVGEKGGSGNGRLPGFLPAQSCSPSAEQIVDIPVPRRVFCGGLQGLHPGQSSTAPDANQNVDFPVPRSGLQGFSSDQGPAGFSTVPPGDQFKGFPTGKKCGGHPASPCRSRR